MERVLIVYILDQTGSMYIIAEPTRDACNEYLDTLRQAPDGNFQLWLTLFNSKEIKTLARGNLAEFEGLTPQNYKPAFTTPLYDAIHVAVGEADAWLKLEGLAGRTYRVLCVIQTDGLENASVHHRLADTKALIEEKQGTGYWEFAYLGANQDAWKVGEGLGMTREHTANYTADERGTHAAFREVAHASMDYGRVRSFRLTDTDTEVEPKGN